MTHVENIFIQQLAKQLINGDDTALNEIRRLKGEKAAKLLEALHTNREAYRKAAQVILEEFGRR